MFFDPAFVTLGGLEDEISRLGLPPLMAQDGKEGSPWQEQKRADGFSYQASNTRGPGCFVRQRAARSRFLDAEAVGVI